MMTGMAQHHIDSMSFCVTSFNKKGDTGTGWGVYLDIGETMNTIPAHPHKKVKFVYDRTIIMNTGWVDQGSISQGNNTFSQFMSQMELVQIFLNK